MKKHVVLFKDEDNEIVLSKDYFNGVVVQVVRLVDQLKNTSEGLVQTRAQNVIFFREAKVTSPNFKADVAAAIEQCRNHLQDIKKKDEEINGLLNDYLSQNRNLNEPAEQ